MWKSLFVCFLFIFLSSLYSAETCKYFKNAFNQDNVGMSTRHNVTNLEYDVNNGLYLEIENYSKGELKYKAFLPLTIDNKPNPQFDRIYAIVLKAISDNSFDKLCFDNEPKNNEIVSLLKTSIIKNDLDFYPKKVSICDQYGHCAAVNPNGELGTTK
jgi:hypothetical protein